METLILSKEPSNLLDKVAYPGQPKQNRAYYPGFEGIIAKMPNPKVNLDMGLLKEGMKEVENKFKGLGVIPKMKGPTFSRTVLGVEDSDNPQEIILAHWGAGFSSPVHGHSKGFLYENLIFGKLRINEYKISDLENKKVRLKRTFIQSPGEIIVTDTPDTMMWQRENYVHNFTALEPSTSLHYVPEHTRDGRDNTFEVEHFELNPNEVKQITSKEAMYSNIGDVILVRSSNVPEYGDHYIQIIGPPVMKDHGLRPDDVAIIGTEKDTQVLNNYEEKTGLILLKLSKEEAIRFNNFHK